MPNLTPNYNFKKPDWDTEAADIRVFNDNMDIADEELKKLEENKQNKEDSTLKTIAKTIVGAINELFSNKLDKGGYTGTAKNLNDEISKKASKTDLGRMIVGDNLTVDDNGRVSGTPAYTHPTGNGNSHIPVNGASGNFLKWLSSGVAQWANITWSDITGKPNSFTPSTHNQDGKTITALTGYAKASAIAGISPNDSLLVALGKLEKALDGKQASGSYALSNHNHNGSYAPVSHGNHVPTPQAANNKVFLRNDNSWQTITPANIGAEPSFTKNTGFNKPLGTTSNTVLEGAKLAEILGLTYGGSLNTNRAKTVNYAYYDSTTKKVYKCIKATSINYADATYFTAISNNDLLGKLQNLDIFEYGSNTNGSWIKNKITGKYKVFIPKVSFAQDQSKTVQLPITLPTNKYIALAQCNRASGGGDTNYIFTSTFTTSNFKVVYKGFADNLSFYIEEY